MTSAKAFSTTRYRANHVLVRSATNTHDTLLHPQIVLSMKESFEPGEYDFSFCYRLREDLPASFVIKDRGANRMRKVNASIAYRLSVSLPLTTGFSADLSVVRPIKVFAQRLAHPVQPIEASACKKIKALGLLSKGECVISAAMDQDAIVAGETLLVETSIKNQTRSDMSSVTLTLFEVLSVHMPERNTYTGEKVVRQEKMSGIQAGEQLDQVLSLPLVAESNALPVLPSTTATFVSWKYLVAIRCGFNMASAVDVELPFAILPFDRPADTVGPTVVTTVELDDKAAAVKTVDC